MSENTIKHKHPIVLYDGVCKFCNRTVLFLIRHDPNKTIRFAPLQSEFGQAFLKQHGLPLEEYDSFIVIENETYYQRSTGFIHAVRYLRKPWCYLSLMKYTPRFIRDWVYDKIGSNRYRLFGKHDQCIIPSEEIKDRFYDGCD